MTLDVRFDCVSVFILCVKAGLSCFFDPPVHTYNPSPFLSVHELHSSVPTCMFVSLALCMCLSDSVACARAGRSTAFPWLVRILVFDILFCLLCVDHLFML